MGWNKIEIKDGILLLKSTCKSVIVFVQLCQLFLNYQSLGYLETHSLPRM